MPVNRKKTNGSEIIVEQCKSVTMFTKWKRCTVL